MKCWIFGSENQKQWTHKSLSTPLNLKVSLGETAGISMCWCYFLDGCKAMDDCVFSVIIFIGDSTFKTKMPDNVRFARGGIEYIKSKRDITLSEDEVADIIEQIESGRSELSIKTNSQHVKLVKEIVKERSDTESFSRCNSDMVLRKTTKGKNAGNEFWGCSVSKMQKYS